MVGFLLLCGYVSLPDNMFLPLATLFLENTGTLVPHKEHHTGDHWLIHHYDGPGAQFWVEQPGPVEIHESFQRRIFNGEKKTWGPNFKQNFNGYWYIYIYYIPSLKLTYPLKIDPWKRRFLLETIIFRGYVSFREGTGILYIIYIRQLRKTPLTTGTSVGFFGSSTAVWLGGVVEKMRSSPVQVSSNHPDYLA